MEKIIPPLTPGMDGPAVVNLQRGLKYLFDDRLIFANMNDQQRSQAGARLAREQEAGKYASTTQKMVADFQRSRHIEPSGAVDERTAEVLNAALEHHIVEPEPAQPPQPPEPAEPPEPAQPPEHDQPEPGEPEFRYLVRGQVLYRGGLPIPGVNVQAFNREMRGERPLAPATTTDDNGNFEIYYNPATLPAGEGQALDRPPDLFLRVTRAADGGQEELLAETPTHYSAPRILKQRILVEGKIEDSWSEFQQLDRELKAHLGDLQIDDLVEDDEHQDVSVLAGKTAQDPARLAQFIAAHKMAAAVGDKPEIFYGLMRSGLPSNLPQLLSSPAGARSDALSSAIKAGIIPGSLASDTAAIKKRLDEHAVNVAVTAPSGISSILKSSIQDSDKADAIAERVGKYKGPPSELWAGLREDAGLKELVPSAQLSLQLGALTGRHGPLIDELLKRKDAGKFDKITDLAAYSVDNWLEIIRSAAGDKVPDAIAGEDAQAREKTYAATLRRIITDTMPTQVLANQAKDDAANGSDVRTFWSNLAKKGDGFELGRGPFRKYLDGQQDLFDNVADKAAVLDHIGETQRLFAMSPDYGEQQMLRSAGLRSAMAVAQLGQAPFLQKMSASGLPQEKALLIYEKAARVSAASLDLMMNISPLFSAGQPMVIEAASSAAPIPDLEQLFGSFNLCACTQCRSVHSAAAYFADLLAFLADREAVAAGTSARDVLLERRPDLGEIELSCTNTNTVLPYTDLVNELLERRIAAFQPFDLGAGAAAELDSRTLSQTVVDLFSAKTASLGPGARVIIGTAGERWSISDGSILYSVELRGGVPRVTGSWPQTPDAGDAVLSAPAHSNPAAYDVLAKAVFPWNLPLHLPTEECRVFLGQLGTARNELISILDPQGPSEALEEAQIAAEFLKLTSSDRKLVTGNPDAPAPKSWDYWGLAENGNKTTVFDVPSAAEVEQQLGWLDALSWVRPMLSRSGLEYPELLDVLESEFVNPGGQMRIVSADPSDLATCDTAKLRITNLDAAAADRLMRFVRLWRLVDFEAADLDNALVGLAASTLDEAFIVKLSHLVRLQASLSLEPDQITALWADIPSIGEQSLYHRLFIEPAPGGPRNDIFALDAGGELAVLASDPASAKISVNAAAVSGAIGASVTAIGSLQDAGLAADDKLSLANLSALYRHALLARALELNMADFLLLKTMSGIDPFVLARTADTIRFVELAGQVSAAGLELADLAYLLFNQEGERALLATPAGATGDVLADLRRGLAALKDSTTLKPDPSGEALARELALARWPQALIDEAVGLVSGRTNFTAPLAPVPAGLAFPPEYDERLMIDEAGGLLRLVGSLTSAEHAALGALSASASYQQAIDSLYSAPRDAAAKRLRAFEWPRVSAPLNALPAGLKLPPALAARLRFDALAKSLSIDSAMSKADKDALDALSSDAAFQTATTALIAAADTFVPDQQNLFVDQALANSLFDQPDTAGRTEQLLSRLLERRRMRDGASLTVRALADASGLKTKIVDRWLREVAPDPANANGKAIDVFLDEKLLSGDLQTPPARADLPGAFEVADRLLKIAALARGMRLSDRAISWIVDWAVTVPLREASWGPAPRVTSRWLSFLQIPVDERAPDPKVFAAWWRLAQMQALSRELPGGERALDLVFREARDSAATADGVLTRLSELTGWDLAELKALSTRLALTLPADLSDESGFLRLVRAMRTIRSLRASVAQAEGWAADQPSAADGTAARLAVQSTFGPGEWADAMRPLEDKLREKKREALVSYLAVRADPALGESWEDSNGLFAHFLIDVETQPVVLTSRLKQAISSVQLFVQRCLMNLEAGVIAKSSDPGWNQWRWMKQYRVWEANRKIFLYPENWLEPELRDDKSPFFAELESALLQADVTSDVAEDLYANYLARLDEVARMEVAGLFQAPGENGAPDELHVIARTFADPPAHFYRKWVGSARWTPWQRIDLDIPRGQILPLIWNRRLYIFWPTFTIKTDPIKAGGDKPVEPTPYFEIQLAWSEYRKGRWGPKKMAPPDSTIRSVVEPDKTDDGGRSSHAFRAVVDGADLEIWYETSAPTSGGPDKYGNLPTQQGIPITKGWRFSGCNGRVTIFTPANVGIFPPPNTVPDGMGFVEARLMATMGMTMNMNLGGIAGPLVTGVVPALFAGSLHLPKGVTGTDPQIVLSNTPGREPFRLMGTHQEPFISGRLPLFFHDDQRTFIILPREDTEWVSNWKWGDLIDTKLVDLVAHTYYKPKPLFDPATSVASLLDPIPAAANVIPRSVPVASSGGGVARALATRVATAPLMVERAARKAEIVAEKKVESPAFSAVGDKKVITAADYLDKNRLLTPIWLGSSVVVRRYQFVSHDHPYTCDLMRELNVHGTDGMLQRVQQLRNSKTFEGRYSPTAMVWKGTDVTANNGYPIEQIDFSFDGAYSGYNWELFYHVPLLIACKLSQNQRFEEAQSWFHAIFDPTDSSGLPSPSKFWRTRPFFEQQAYLKDRIDRLLEALAKGQSDPEMSRQVSEWIANPFQPFAIGRLRTTAFQRTVVMKYLDNLIAWADQLFRRDTIEAINEATQLYILAAEILGPRPPVLEPRAEPDIHTFNTLKPKYEELTNEFKDIEAVIASPRVDAVLTSPDAPPLPMPQMLYFCVPPNDKLLGYWDIVADRLMKIRNSLNLAGLRRTLPLFEPPIDPMLLIRAAAAGADLGSAIADLGAPPPNYRFAVLAQKTAELCSEVKFLGSALLEALDRRDAEDLARIQMSHEIDLLKEVKKVREDQVSESKAQITALEAARELTGTRYRHFMELLGKSDPLPAEGTAPQPAEAVAGAGTLLKDGVRMISQEASELGELAEAADSESDASGWELAASLANAIPNFSIAGMPFGTGSGISFGGPNLGAVLGSVAGHMRGDAAEHRNKSQKASRLGQFIMRANDWKLEADIAAKDIARIDRDLAAARVREAIAIKELDNHLRQTEQREAEEEFLTGKFTNRELHEWRIGQISSVYFQAYQLAYDMARRSELAYRRDLGVASTDFIQFGYWDSLRKGLSAGDLLLQSVRRMEASYLESNEREYEITKHVSLASLNPEALLALQEQGSCLVDLPEALFDLDHPGQYMRRIKAVQVTVPAITGPYTSIPLKLTLLASRTRREPRPTPQYAVTGSEDPRFEFSSGGLKSIVISSGREDSGLFELNLRDERYLPFEGAGVISSWRLELPAEFRGFDYRTISDVILHLRYCAREGGDLLRAAAVKDLAPALRAMQIDDKAKGLVRGFGARGDFPDAWHGFAFKPDSQPGVNTLDLMLSEERFPAFARERTKVTRLAFALVPQAGVDYDESDPLTARLTLPGGATEDLSFEVKPGRTGGLPMGEAVLDAPIRIKPSAPGSPAKPWRLEVTHVPASWARSVDIDGEQVDRLDPAKIADVAVLVGFDV